MDKEMIERCAKAVFDSLADQSGFGLNNENLSEVFLDGEFDLKSVTIAVIKAMREPTQNMIDDGMWIAPAGEIVGEYGAKEVWHNMIDSITGETNE